MLTAILSAHTASDAKPYASPSPSDPAGFTGRRRVTCNDATRYLGPA
jgi:hypothetical protein